MPVISSRSAASNEPFSPTYHIDESDSPSTAKADFGVEKGTLAELPLASSASSSHIHLHPHSKPHAYTYVASPRAEGDSDSDENEVEERILAIVRTKAKSVWPALRFTMLLIIDKVFSPSPIFHNKPQA